MSLDIIGVSKAFGSVPAVAGVDLAVKQGELFALLGPSGCGKTTLLRIIAGIYPLDCGSLTLNGRDIGGLPMHKRNLAMVFQNYALFPHLTVFENVAFGLRSRKVGGQDLERRVKEALNLVRLEALAERYPAQLSGGQQQRVSLARAVAVAPDLLLLDEPLSNLDARLRDEMRIEIRDLQRRLGITTVFVTHDIGEAFAMADRVAVMRDGKILQVGQADEIYKQPASRFIANFLGPINELTIATVEGAGRRTAVVEGGQHVRLAESTAVNRAAPGMRLILRPEALHINPAAGATDNNLDAVVEDIVFLGGSTEARVRAGSLRLLVSMSSAMAVSLQTGQRVKVGWSSADGVVARDQ
jgi:spermidine/putrescine ABC transporter ATP-binding subunit